MSEIVIIKKEEKNDHWEFGIRMDGVDFEVTLDKNYWQKLTSEKEKPESLVNRSFEFLLEREPKESILKSFNLKQIKSYFPDYEEKIKK